MANIRFNYRDIKGYSVNMELTSEELENFEIACKIKIAEKYQDRLVSPCMEVIVSENCRNIMRAHLFADAILN